MSEKMKKSDKVKMSSRPKNDRLNKSDIKKQTWRAGNMLYPVPAVMVICARKGEKPNIITEASFEYNKNFCSVDILKNDVDGIEIYEVKSSTSINDIYFDDISYQVYVLLNLGYKVKKASIIKL